MPSDKYEKYSLPKAPADLTAEYMTVQETAYVLRCSVSHLRRVLREHPHLCSRPGRRIVINRAAREAIYEINRAPAKSARRRRPATKRLAAA